jgi:hypothetical protein
MIWWLVGYEIEFILSRKDNYSMLPQVDCVLKPFLMRIRHDHTTWSKGSESPGDNANETNETLFVS